ncbi:MAG: peptidoglycan-binding protein [Treponema sp.]|jgi:hypothetical protein|nr:peptidoglycan-binding protein [Treponema sp.]
MSCAKILDIVYEQQEDMSLFNRIRVGLHLLVCPDCAQEVERFEVCRDMLQDDFMYPAPDLEDAVMSMINAEEAANAAANATANTAEAAEAINAEIPGGFSIRGWIIAGIVMLVSLATVFFGLEFNKVALIAGMAFTIPIGITIGIALTSYGALFIGSHLKDLTERFGL